VGEIQYLIYQLKSDDDLRELRFESLEQLKAQGLSVDWGNYNHMYTGTVDPGDAPISTTLENLYEKFNVARPADFVGHSLSVGDVVALQRGEDSWAYYVDSFGFADVPEFLDAPYRYYSTQRPVDIGTYPKADNNLVLFANYDKREYCENDTFRAWGYLAYDAPLTERQIADYELRAASDNPDRDRVSPFQFDAQIQAIGKYEDSKHMNLYKRLTWLHNDFGVYIKHENVPPARIGERFAEIVGIKARAAERLTTRKRPIAEQLAECERQAARENTAPPVPAPGKDKEDRA
jgi:hypothetical protein